MELGARRPARRISSSFSGSIGLSAKERTARCMEMACQTSTRRESKQSHFRRMICGPVIRRAGYDPDMNEAHFAEIEKTLLYISDARQRAERAVQTIAKTGAEPHLVEALEEAERELEALGRKLMQRTYFAVPDNQLTLKA